MEIVIDLSLDALVILLLIFGIHLFKTPRTARLGNQTAALAMVMGAVMTLWRSGLWYPGFLAGAAAAGTLGGWALAVRTSMLQIPAMIAFQHGAGGLAACLVAIVELAGSSMDKGIVARSAGIAGLVVGAATFSASLVACGKLSGRIRQQPTVLAYHDAFLVLNGVGVVLLMALGAAAGNPTGFAWLGVTSILAAVLGVLFSIRIGGADMPVLISFLNATAGLAAALCGVILHHRLLIAFGATVAASGSILTHIMCRAMNRGLVKVFTGSVAASQPDGLAALKEIATREDLPREAINESPRRASPLQAAVQAVREAASVIIIPGYGMALAQAQFQVARLAEKLQAMGKSVKFAIHPVAGRMPGHMHVLLAEAEIDYTHLYDMEAINADFEKTDLALVIGACDVVNPAAIEVENTPLSGMPILLAKDARNIVVCNLDEQPGYSGVRNSLYQDPKTILLLGDAQESIVSILDGLQP